MGAVSHPWINTYTDRVLNPLLPQEQDIDIVDIAHSLSNLCRFTGHCEFYSVAQHSVLVSYLVDPQFEKEALLHDAAEAYINDLNSPVKSLILGDYKKMEAELELCIAKKFGLVHPMPKEIKDADYLAFKLEVQRLFKFGSPLWKKYIDDINLFKTSKYKPIQLLTPVEAKSFFLRRYAELFEMPVMGEAASLIMGTEEDDE